MTVTCETLDAQRGAEITALVTAVQISPSTGPSEWQKEYEEQARHSRRIAPVMEVAE